MELEIRSTCYSSDELYNVASNAAYYQT